MAENSCDPENTIVNLDSTFYHLDTVIHETYVGFDATSRRRKHGPTKVIKNFNSFDSISRWKVTVTDKTTSSYWDGILKYNRVRVTKLDSIDNIGRIVYSEWNTKKGENIDDIFESDETIEKYTAYGGIGMSNYATYILDKSSKDTLRVTRSHQERIGGPLTYSNPLHG